MAAYDIVDPARLCGTCKYRQHRPANVYMSPVHTCTREFAKLYDPIDGEERQPDCYEARSLHMPCGPKGQLWEVMDE